MRKSDIVDVTVLLHHETDRAVLVSDDGDREKAIWLPLSQCEIEKVGSSLRPCPNGLLWKRG